MENCIQSALFFRTVKEVGTQEQIQALPFQGHVRRLCNYYKISEACMRVRLRHAYETPFEDQMTILRQIGYNSRYVNELTSQYCGDSGVEEEMER